MGGATGKRLRSWRWSSFGAYAGGKIPDWLATDRILRALQLSEDGRGGKAYAGYLEARAKDRKRVVSDEALVEFSGDVGAKAVEVVIEVRFELGGVSEQALGARMPETNGSNGRGKRKNCCP